jgi:hypothetical protein
MRRELGVVSAIILSIFVGGCALPVSVTVASWALDGVSYMATNKSLTDHGISFVSGQDCAMHRVVTEMDVYALCQDYEDPQSKVIAIADASEIIEQQLSKNDVDETFYGFDLAAPSPMALAPSVGQSSPEIKAATSADELSIAEIANFETASGGPESQEDQSDFEKLEDPAKPAGLSIKGFWNFLVDISS